VLRPISLCRHAVAITPVGPQMGSCCSPRTCGGGLLHPFAGSAPTLPVSRPARRSLVLRPACSRSRLGDPLHQRLRQFRYLHYRSDCYRLEQPLPGGNCTRWRSAPYHGAQGASVCRDRRAQAYPRSSWRVAGAGRVSMRSCWPPCWRCACVRPSPRGSGEWLRSLLAGAAARAAQLITASSSKHSFSGTIRERSSSNSLNCCALPRPRSLCSNSPGV